MSPDRPALIYWYTFSSLRRDTLDQVAGGDSENDPLMPALAEFSEGAVFFENALSSSGSPLLSAASMLTGLWPSRLGIKDCPVAVQGQGRLQAFGLDSAVQTLPGGLVAQGYSTFSHPDSQTPSPGDGLERGFTDPRALPERIEEGRGIFVWHQAEGAGPPFAPTGMALDHLGLEPPDPDKRTPEDDHNLYRAAAFDADRAFARALGELSQAGLWESSLIVVTANCGPELFEPGSLKAPTGLYQKNLAVPLLIKFPSDHPLARYHGQRFSPRVRLIDLAPTLALIGTGEEMAGIDGRDLGPLIRGEEEGDRDLIGFHSALAQGTGEPVIHEALAIIRGSSKALGGFRESGEELRELYDLSQDPEEAADLAKSEPDLFQELMVAAASQGTPLAGPDRGPAPEADEEEKEALVEKLRSLGYL